MFVRAHTIERMFTDIAHRDVSPQWNTILHKLREMGVTEGRIPALPHPADTADITAIRGDVYG